MKIIKQIIQIVVLCLSTYGYSQTVTSNGNPVGLEHNLLFHANKSSSDLIFGLGTVRELPAPYKVWLNIAQQENIILIVPNGTNKGWNDCRNDASGNPNSDDVLFTKNLIDFALGCENLKLFVNIGTSSIYGLEATFPEDIVPKPASVKAFM